MVYVRKSLWVSSTDQWVTFYGWIRAEGLKVLRVFSVAVPWKEDVRDNDVEVRFKGITGSVQDFGTELKY